MLIRLDISFYLFRSIADIRIWLFCLDFVGVISSK